MAAASGGRQRWAGAVKQVTKSNFTEALQQLRAHVNAADFIAVSCSKTGDCTAASGRRSWHRVLPFDTPEVAYLKAKLAAESYEILQFAVCPFQHLGSKVLAFPYNFHLFPRDELKLGMPSYSFSCQTSVLASMAREGFDFNACIYDGISYLSRVQESMVKERYPSPQIQSLFSCSSLSVADSIFVSRIKSRVEHWWNACKKSNSEVDGSLLQSLRKLIVGSELYGARPSMSIDVCSDYQVQLATQTISSICNDLVTMIVPDKSGEASAIRVVLTSSEEDKNLLMTEIQALEDEKNLKVRGFRGVIDMISCSNKPIIGYNCLLDFTFMHSKFVAPLPPTLSEFMCSLRLVFTNILDVNHLSKEAGTLRKAKNLPAALGHFKRQHFVPIDIEVPEEDERFSNKAHGHNVLRTIHLFSLLSALLKLLPDGQIASVQHIKAIEGYSNIFYPSCTCFEESDDEELKYPGKNAKKVTTDNLVFLWGLNNLIPEKLKHSLQQAHHVFKEDFELQLMDNSCAAIIFPTAGSAHTLLKDMRSGELCSDALSKMISEGLKAVEYTAYREVCRLGLWEADLADSLDNVISDTVYGLSASHEKDTTEVCGRSASTFDLNVFPYEGSVSF